MENRELLPRQTVGSSPTGPTKIKPFLIDRRGFFVYATSMTMDQRALATVEEITELRPIEGADSIEVARIRGWDVVVRIGDFEVGDLVVYFEIDSFLPLDDPRFTFLAPRGARKNQDGVEGHVLKTARLRGVYSQGLALPFMDFEDEIFSKEGFAFLGMDITPSIPGLEKWDPPIPAELSGSAIGGFPGTFRKTDEERIQNMLYALDSHPDLDGGWYATEKIDGSSMTVYIEGEKNGVAGRNWDFEDTKFHSMWNLAREHDLHTKIREWASAEGKPESIAVQGEIFGPGIQGNPLNVKTHQFRIFTVQTNREDTPREAWPEWAKDLAVPVHPLPYPQTPEEALDQVESLKSLINPERVVEGIVWRNTKGTRFPNGSRASWKAISQRYLLKHDR